MDEFEGVTVAGVLPPEVEAVRPLVAVDAPNPFAGAWERGDSDPALEEVLRRAIVSAALLQGEGWRVHLEMAGPESLYYTGLGLLAACQGPAFADNPHGRMMAERMGRAVAEILLDVPEHGASLRPLGQVLLAGWESYDRGAWILPTLGERCAGETSPPADTQGDDTRPLSVVLRSLAGELVSMADAVASHADELADAVASVDLPTVAAAAAERLAPHLVPVHTFPEDEPTPILDEVTAGLGDTQIIPAEAIEAALAAADDETVVSPTVRVPVFAPNAVGLAEAIEAALAVQDGQQQP